MNTIIHTPTNDLKKSIDFYKRLSFKVVAEKESVYVSDGKALIEINPDRFARAGVKFYRENWSGLLDEIKEDYTVVDIEGGHIISDVSGVFLYLMNGKPPVEFQPEKESYSTLGNFAGVSMETISIPHSAKLWKQLGFKVTMGSEEQGWIAFQNEEGFGVSFMKPNSCPHLFFNPSLTYFNGKNNLSVIGKIRDLNIPIAEEITIFNKEGIVDNIIIMDPGGYGFFIFSD